MEKIAPWIRSLEGIHFGLKKLLHFIANVHAGCMIPGSSFSKQWCMSPHATVYIRDPFPNRVPLSVPDFVFFDKTDILRLAPFG